MRAKSRASACLSRGARARFVLPAAVCAFLSLFLLFQLFAGGESAKVFKVRQKQRAVLFFFVWEAKSLLTELRSQVGEGG